MKDQTLAKTGHENTGLENNRRKNNGQNFCENYGPENDRPKMEPISWRCTPLNNALFRDREK